MIWPERPTAHNSDPWAHRMQHTSAWRAPDSNYPYRTCSYCGSICPEDLYNRIVGGPVKPPLDHDANQEKALDAFEAAGGQDKQVYKETLHAGYRTYAEMPGIRFNVADWKYGWPHKVYIDGRGLSHAKWYNIHLLDQGYDAEALTALIEEIRRYSGIRFEVKEGGKLYYHNADNCPC
jgi:hypothetical protein